MLPIFKFFQEEITRLAPEDLYVPPEPVGEHEEVVDVLTDPALQKLWTLQIYMERDARIALAHAKATAGETSRKYLQEVAALAAKSSAAELAFWISVKDIYKLWGTEGTGLRVGWKIVKIDFVKQHNAMLKGLGLPPDDFVSR